MSRGSHGVTGGTTALQAARDGGGLVSITATADRHLEVAIHEPASAFGEVLVAEPRPRVQIDFAEGLLSTDHESLTDGSSGSVTASASMVICATGTSIGGYGVVRSRRMTRYRPGQGIRSRFTVRWPSAPTANSLVLAGVFNAEDGLFIGYSGTTFGILRRIAGACHITRLTVSAGAGGSETLTVTLNGTAYTVAASGVLSTAATAELIAERVGGYTGWTSSTSNGSVVTFVQATPAAVSGAFTLTSTGAAAGTFATVQAGAANDSVTGFIAQSAWNVDIMDGSGGASNPSGLTAAWSNLAVVEFVIPYLGAGAIEIRVQDPNREFNTIHRIEYPNSNTIPSFKNPTFRVGWIAASLGSTTNLEIRGVSGAMFIEGPVEHVRDPFATAPVTVSASTTEYVALALRIRTEFASRLCQREIFPHTVFVANETSNRIIAVSVYLNPTITGTVNWTYIDQDLSAVEFATPSTITPSGGRRLATRQISTQAELDLNELNIRCEPGDVLVITTRTVTSTATGSVSATWWER